MLRGQVGEVRLRIQNLCGKNLVYQSNYKVGNTGLQANFSHMVRQKKMIKK